MTPDLTRTQSPAVREPVVAVHVADDFRAELAAWVAEPGTSAEEHIGRIDAERKILEWVQANGSQPAELTARLDLRGLHLRTLPAALAQLQNLRDLDVAGNALESLPPEIGALSHLAHLNLARNQLRELPREFGDLAHLQLLSVRGNPLAHLPQTFGNLTNLRFLWLDECELTELPETFARLRSLESLSLNDNQLTALPGNLATMERLRAFSAERNPQLARVEVAGLMQQLAQVRAAAQARAAVVVPGAGQRVRGMAIIQQPFEAWIVASQIGARGQTDAMKAQLAAFRVELIAAMRQDSAFADRCVGIARGASDSAPRAFLALNDMHEALMAWECQQPGTTEARLIELGADLFVLSLVKQAALAFSAHERAAGHADLAAAMTLQRQSSLCERLGLLGFRAPLPTRGMAFAHIAETTEEQADRENRLVETLHDGGALRRQLASWPPLAAHVRRAYADEFNDLLEPAHAKMEELEKRNEQGEINEGEYLRNVDVLAARLDADTTALRRRLVSLVIARQLGEPPKAGAPGAGAVGAAGAGEPAPGA